MNAALQLRPDIPHFGLSGIYKNNIWNIREWDIYSQASEKQKAIWNSRVNTPNKTIDFTLCKNSIIREELKYIMFKIINSGVKINTFAEYYMRLKHLIDYVNQNNLSTLIDINIDEYYCFLKSEITNLSEHYEIVIDKDMNSKSYLRKNRNLTFLLRAQTEIAKYFEQTIPKYDRDVWRMEDFPEFGQESAIKNINFTEIMQPSLKKALKKMAFHKLKTLNISSVSRIIKFISYFSLWLYEYDSEIEKFIDINRDTYEDFFLYLRTESGFSQNMINSIIRVLKSFIDYEIIIGNKDFPSINPILNNDYAFKTKREAEHYSDNEIRNIIAILPKMNSTLGKILFTFLYTGIRGSELINLQPSALVVNDDGSYEIEINQKKTKKYYSKTINHTLYTLLVDEIKKNKKLYNTEPEYIFLNSVGHKFQLGNISKHINEAFVEFNVLNDEGNLLRFRSHKMRATFATNMLDTGTDAKTVSKLLGHSSLESLTHYVRVTDNNIIKHLTPMLKRKDALINNIGKVDILKKPETSIENIPLCNGWCNINPSAGICKKANICLECELFQPSPQFLNGYMLQLQEIEASIKLAEANGMEMLLQKNIKTKDSLLNIIMKIQKMEVEKDE